VHNGLQNAYSAFGAFLDPVADKLMVATTMILLCTRPLPLGVMAGNAWLLPLLTTGEYAACLTPAAQSEALPGWLAFALFLLLLQLALRC
jgi:CDP-diacylglycerol--glycerol-3-phosphate 3-phosphatidyltransferase